MAIRVRCEVPVGEIDGRAIEMVSNKPRPVLEIESHRLDSRAVVVRFGDQTVTVLANELEAAVRNASNKS